MQVIHATVKQESPGGDIHIVPKGFPEWTGPAIVMPLSGHTALDRANWHLQGSGYQIESDKAQNFRLVNKNAKDLPNKDARTVLGFRAEHLETYLKSVLGSLQRPACEYELVEDRRTEGTTSWFLRPRISEQPQAQTVTDNLEVDRDTMRQVIELFNTLLDDESPSYSAMVGRPVLKELRRVRDLLPAYDGCRKQIGSKDPRIQTIIDRFRTGRNALGRDAGTDEEATLHITFADFKYLMGKLGLQA